MTGKDLNKQVRSIIYRIISIGLAVLMLLTSIDYTIDMHFCQGNLKSFSFFGNAEKCYKGEPSSQKCIHSTNQQETEFSKKACCSNKTMHAKLSQNQVSSNQSTFTKSSLDFASIVPNHLSFLAGPVREHLNIQWLYKPPLPQVDRHSLFQVFRL